MRILLSCIATALMIPLAYSEESVNALWDFEKGNQDWRPWGIKSADNLSDKEIGSIVTVSSTGAYAGKNCLVLSDSFEQCNPYMSLGKSINPDVKKIYIFSGYIKSDDLAGSYAAAGIACESNGKFVRWDKNKILLTKEWQEFSVMISNIPKQTTDLRPGVFIFEDSSNPAKKGSIQLDNLRFSENTYTAIDTSAYVNRAYQDADSGDGKGGWTDQGENDMRGMTGGEKNYFGIPFKVSNKGAIGFKKGAEGFHQELDIKIPEQRFDYLYLLNTAAWAKGKAGTISFNYTDGSSASVEIECPSQCGDWWNGTAKNAAAIALEKVCPRQSPVYVFVSPLKNPNPDKSVNSLKISAGDNDSLIWMILAISSGTGPNKVETSIAATTDFSKYFHFALKNVKSNKPLVDLSKMLDAPAGKHGFLKTEKGHFVFEDGSPARFWGTNIHANQGIFPSHEQAEAVADTLARYGVNLVRLHLTEYELIDHSYPDRQHFITNEEKLDKFDYFVKCLNDRGIYLLLDSVTGLSARGFTKDDGLEGWKEYGSHRPWAYYEPKFAELGKKYIKDYLTRKNKYTGKTLLENPGAAMIMLINEQSIFFDWGTKNGNPEYYSKLLDKLFNEWLQKKYGTEEAFKKAWTSPDGVSAILPGESFKDRSIKVLNSENLIPSEKWNTMTSKIRTLDSTEFYQETQIAWFKGMKETLKALGCKIPIAGTNIIYGAAELSTHRTLDYTSQNVYYDHMVLAADNSIMEKNIPMSLINPIENGRGLVEPPIAAVKIKDRPVTSTETDAMWPHEWRSSHLLTLAATSALQDWDAMFQYAYMGGWGYTWDQSEKFTTIQNPTVEFNDPAIFGVFPAAAILYHRRDVSPSKNLVQLVYDKESGMQQNQNVKQGSYPFNYLSYVSRVESSFDGSSKDADLVIGKEKPEAKGIGSMIGFGKTAKYMELNPGSEVSANGGKSVMLDKFMKENGLLKPEYGLQEGKIISDNGEFIRDWKRGIISVNTKGTQGFTGLPGTKQIDFDDIIISSPNLFATVIVSALDKPEIGKASELLLTTVARAWNDTDKITYSMMGKTAEGIQYGERLSLVKGKNGKVMTEKVEATVKIKANSAKLTALTPDMRAAGASVEFKADSNGFVSVKTGEGTASIWYLLEISR